MSIDVVEFLDDGRSGRRSVNRLKGLDRSDEVLPRSIRRHAAPPLSMRRNQATAIMADHSGLDNNAGLDGGVIEAHGREMLAAPAIMGLGENAAHRSYFGVEMGGAVRLAVAAQAAGAVLDDFAGDLRPCGPRACPGAASRERRADR